jgi:hypothetical protein
MACWNKVMGDASPVVQDDFDSKLFKTYVDESNEVWLPKHFHDRISSSFACFYQFTLGPGFNWHDDDEQKKLLKKSVEMTADKKIFYAEQGELLRHLMAGLIKVEALMHGKQLDWREVDSCTKIPDALK